MAAHRMEEQRQDSRIRAELPVRIRRLDGVEDEVSCERGHTQSISNTGLSFLSEMDLPTGTPLLITIGLPESAGNIEVEASVTRVSPDMSGIGGFEYGVSFDTASHAEELAQFIELVDIVPLLRLMSERNATSLHLSVFNPPMFRINGRLTPARDEPLDPSRVERLIYGMLSPSRRQRLESERQLDFPLGIPEFGRWRVNVHHQQGHVEATLRPIDVKPPTLEALHMPSQVHDLALLPSGLVLVTGIDHHQTQAAMAAMVEALNREASKAIVTIEYSVEFLYDKEHCVVKQREIGRDVRSFPEGIMGGTKQDADVIVVAEICDYETLQTAFYAAEHGHLVLGAFHAGTFNDALGRIDSLIPERDRRAALHLLSMTLKGLVFVHPPRTADAPAADVLLVDAAARQALAIGSFGDLQKMPG